MKFNSKGATLIEMLVGISILGCITLLIANNLYQQVQGYLYLNHRYSDVIELKNATETYLTGKKEFHSQRGNTISFSVEDSLFNGKIYIIQLKNHKRDEMMSVEVFSFNLNK